MPRSAIRIAKGVGAGAFAAGVTLMAAGPASAIGATLVPDTQSVCSGCYATWGGAWTGTSPYNVVFYYGDGTDWSVNGTTSTSHGWSHSFYTCTGQEYTQHLHVQDHTGAKADAYAYTSVTKGNICTPTG